MLLEGIHILGFEFLSFASKPPEEFLRNEQELADLVRSGQAVPHIGATFDLDDVAAALRHVADGNAVGNSC